MISFNWFLESSDKKELKSCSSGTGYSGRKYWSVVSVTLHFCAMAKVLFIKVSGSQSLNKFDLEPLESYLMFGKGPGQDGAINPYAKYIKSNKGYLISSKDCYSIIENLGTSGFSIRIQKDGRIIKTIPIKKNETKKILLDAGNELSTDASFEGRAKFKVTFEDVSL